jgi:peptide/nickel transport system ATP-binding protein
MNQLEICDLKTYFFLDEGILKAVDGVNLTVGDRDDWHYRRVGQGKV